MDSMDLPLEMASIASLLLVTFLNTQHMLTLLESPSDEEDANFVDAVPVILDGSTLLDAEGVSRAALHHWGLWNSLTALDDDLGFWVKPRSTAWFSTFLLEEYDDARWIHLFQMTKKSVFTLSSLIAPSIQKSNTNYRQAIPVLIRLACSLFKLCQGSSLLLCSELFAIGRSSVSIVLREVVEAINIVLRSQVAWPSQEKLPSIASAFEKLGGLPAVLGAIDGTHFAIAKPRNGSADYFYFKSGGYSMNCQAVVEASKRFLDLNVGMPGSTHDARMLRRSTLFHRGQHGSLWPGTSVIHGFQPYLIGDAGYPLLTWLMVPHRRHENLFVPDALFNRRLSRGRAVVENAFALLKQSFREPNRKSELHVTFFPDVVAACVLLHNLLLQPSHEEVEVQLEMLRQQCLQDREQQSGPASADVDDAPAIPVDVGAGVPVDVGGGFLVDGASGVQAQHNLGVFLTLQRMANY